MLHYTPQHVLNSTLLIIRRTNCITTASGIDPFVSSRTVCGWRADGTYILLKIKRIVH